ncbi:hypothetical protein ABK040_011671 [Willaertia magna]
MRLTFLGTSSGVPTTKRNVSSMALQLESGQIFLIDCGEGTQHQLQKSSLKSGKITRIFITHLHGDHVYGLPGLLCTLSGNNPETRTHLHIYGPLGLKSFLRQTLSLSDAHLGFVLKVHELVPKDMTKEDVVKYEKQLLLPLSSELEDNASSTAAGEFHYFDETNQCFNVADLSSDCGLVVKAAPIEHRVYCVGYVFHENDKVGKLDMEKAKQLGVPKGPLLGQLKNGKEITLDNGKTIHPKDVIGDDIKGRKLVVLGDTHNPEGIAKIAENCDTIVHEATLEDSKKEMAIERGHSCPSMAATFAKSIGAKKLILTHFSARYVEETDESKLHENEVSISLLLRQAKEVFENVELAEDFKEFIVEKSN